MVKRLAVTVALLLSPAGRAEPEGADAYNPGMLGPNALPPQRGEPAWIPPSPQVSLGVAIQRTQSVFGADDASLTLPFRVEIPFAGRASLIAEGQPFEWWLASSATREAWQPSSWHALSRADIRIGGKFLVFNGGRRWPSFAIRALTKTTTGKSFFDHRFINAPGYLFDALVSHRFELGGGSFIDAWLNAGFLAWQQGAYGQNDAPALSATVRLGRPDFVLALEARGYRGWQKYDKPVELEASVEFPMGLVTPFFGATWSVVDPPFVEVRIGVRLGRSLAPAASGDLDESPPRVLHGWRAVFLSEPEAPLTPDLAGDPAAPR